MYTTNKMKTLMLAGAAVLSLGVSSAFASGSGVAGADYWATQQQHAALQAHQPLYATPYLPLNQNSAVQYGSSDPGLAAQPDTSMGVSGGF